MAKKCSRCNGTGKVGCPSSHIKFAGSLAEGMALSGAIPACTRCGGKSSTPGRITCPACNGKCQIDS